MKKLVVIALSCALILTLFTGCGASGSSADLEKRISKLEERLDTLETNPYILHALEEQEEQRIYKEKLKNDKPRDLTAVGNELAKSLEKISSLKYTTSQNLPADFTSELLGKQDMIADKMVISPKNTKADTPPYHLIILRLNVDDDYETNSGTLYEIGYNYTSPMIEPYYEKVQNEAENPHEVNPDIYDTLPQPLVLSINNYFIIGIIPPPADIYNDKIDIYDELDRLLGPDFYRMDTIEAPPITGTGEVPE